MLSALIFDVDGTLADTERFGHRDAYNRAFKKLGLDWHWDESLYGELLTVSGGKERMEFYAKNFLNEFQPPTGFDLDQLLDRIHQLKTEIFVSMVRARKFPLRPGIGRIIKQARFEGVRLAIATSTQRRNALALLTAALGADSVSWFDLIAGGDDIHLKKPAPDIYRYVLDKIGLPGSRCMAIEDSNNGLRSAVGAGIPTLVTSTDYTRDEDFREAVVVVNHLGEPGNPVEVIKGGEVIGNPSLLNLGLLRKIHKAQLPNRG